MSLNSTWKLRRLIFIYSHLEGLFLWNTKIRLVIQHNIPRYNNKNPFVTAWILTLDMYPKKVWATYDIKYMKKEKKPV